MAQIKRVAEPASGVATAAPPLLQVPRDGERQVGEAEGDDDVRHGLGAPVLHGGAGDGRAADRLDQRLMIIGCVVVIMAGCLALPFVIGDTMLLWADMLAMGAAMGGFYTVGMVMLGQRFKGADLAAANAVFVVTWGLGSVGGPTITGAAMEQWGASAMPYVVIAFCLAYLPLAVARYLQKRRRGGDA